MMDFKENILAKVSTSCQISIFYLFYPM